MGLLGFLQRDEITRSHSFVLVEKTAVRKHQMGSFCDANYSKCGRIPQRARLFHRVQADADCAFTELESCD